MICPNCQVMVQPLEKVKSKWQNDAYHDTILGLCPRCMTLWEWDEIFQFTREENIKLSNRRRNRA